MQKHRALVLSTALAAAAWMPLSVGAQKGKPKPTNTELHSTFRDAPSDAISSDGAGFYETNETTKTQNVLTETSAANYILDPFTATRGTGVRCVDLNLTGVVALAPGATLPAGGCVDSRFATLSFFFDDKDSLRNMVGGQFVPKRMAIRWEVGNTVYWFRFPGRASTSATEVELTNWPRSASSAMRQKRQGAFPGRSNQSTAASPR